MLSELTHRLARSVTTRWGVVLGFWIFVTVVFVATAPKWKDIAYDGDFEYLPERMNTVVAAKILDEAFPGDRARSQIVVVLGRQTASQGESGPPNEAGAPKNGGEFNKDELMVGDDLLRRLHHRLAEVCWQRAIALGYEGGSFDEAPEPARNWLDRTLESHDQAYEVDQRFD